MNIYLPHGTSPSKVEEVRRAVENTGHPVNWIGTLADQASCWHLEYQGVEVDDALVIDTVEDVLVGP
ncbi:MULTISPECIES: hypothetical protein [unclassified Modicisalibacter]|uniref:hypothetical protein n=1 Tax=unclassified Modicisalibacter TaxID=2679913 RepID=UPI001CCE1B13|nr:MULTISPECIES: hypothetical protein [unclassified Modicisalibacter]MBZ9559090.1 hypothetical protein [Modicisalibacter sp. R2A 31.J]MBZ9576799.1 hypothetical protein [Modicisalibacter sp. MOD 31.J]